MTAPPPEPPAPQTHPALAALGRSPWVFPLVSLLLLAPCYWQSRIQAGDLASHIYNSWLAQQIAAGRLQGLEIVRQTTNILFDLMLSALFQLWGAQAAQRIAVSLAVLIFVWGAFAFAAAVSGRRPWQILPCIAMLAYGWVFHMGFFNFYLSLGLCFWAMALLWEPNPPRVAAAIALFAAAYVAHALPVAWAVCLVAYRWLTGRATPRARVYIIAATLLGLIALHIVMAATVPIIWSAQQLTLTTGLDQLWIFDGKYYAILVGLLIVWASMFLRLTHLSGGRQVLSNPLFQLCAIAAAGVLILPTSVLLPGYRHALAFIAERMSLGVGICVCALLAAVRLRPFEQYAMTLIVLVFFGFLYRDERRLNHFEDRMQEAVAAVPLGQRVISAIQDPELRVNALAHIVDRVCIGRCYSYANYEPSTAQFRIRATAENPYVAYTYEDSWLLQMGQYPVKPRDLPLYLVDLDPGGHMIVKSLPVGSLSGSTSWNILGDLL